MRRDLEVRGGEVLLQFARMLGLRISRGLRRRYEWSYRWNAVA